VLIGKDNNIDLGKIIYLPSSHHLFNMTLGIPLLEAWPFATWALVAVVTLYTITYQLSTRKHDPREPPILASKLPYVGHLLGMALYGSRYIKTLGLRNRQTPIFTLPVPNSRIYIVTDPSLAAAVQRASKVLSFTPIIPEVTERILGLDKATKEIASKNLDPAPGEEKGFLADIQEMVYLWLGPGEYLGEITTEAAKELKSEVDAYRKLLETRPRSRDVVDLLDWVRHFVTVSTAKYLYGPQNPIARDPDLESAFWDFDHGLGALLVNVFPSITARKAYYGRERLVAALVDYLEAGTYKTGSKIIQERISLALKHGWTLRAAARSELSFLFAGIVNMTTSTFWILLQIFADPNLLSGVRSEIESIISKHDGDSGDTAVILSINDIKTKCPLLIAVYRECLRLNSDNNSIRVVKESTLLADRYFLAKDAVVQIAGGVIHADESIWGPNANTFNPGRYLDQQPSRSQAVSATEEVIDKEARNNTKGKEKQIHPAAFRAYGGGKTLCPGRHFAMNEILSFVALIVLQFDMEAPTGDGINERINVPRKNDGVLPVHILEPVESVKVAIHARVGWEGKDVGIVLGKE
jgi:cytochrome P450